MTYFQDEPKTDTPAAEPKDEPKTGDTPMDPK